MMNRFFHRAVPLLIVLAVTGAVYFPWLLSKVPLGEDQDLFLICYEAFRQSVLTFREFPFWNPWCHGGVPLFANPQICVFGWEGLFVLLFGTWKGLHLALFLQFLIGGAGMYLFLEEEKTPARIYGALAFVLAGGLQAHLAEGHAIAASFLHVPLFLYFVKHLPDSFGMALLTGCMAALLTNSCLHYFTIIAFVLGGLIFLRYGAEHGKEKRLYLHLFAAFLAWMALGGIRLTVTLDHLLHFPRTLTQEVWVPPLNILKAFLVPFIPLNTFAAGGSLRYGWWWHEITCHTGIILLCFALISTVRKPGWKPLAALFFFALAFDNTMRCFPGYWLQKIFPFSSFFVILRWRFALLFFLIWSAADGVSLLWEKRKTRGILLGAAVLSLLMMAANQLHLFYGNRALLSEEDFLNSVPLPEQSAGTITPVFLRKGSMYGHIRKGYAVLNSYEPLLGYSKVCHIPAERYQAPFFFCRNGGTELVKASPNRFTFRTKGPGIFFLNQNPGNYWTDGVGKQLFPEMREFEETRLFLAAPLRQGEWELRLVPPLFRTGCLLSGISCLILLIWILCRCRKNQRESRHII